MTDGFSAIKMFSWALGAAMVAALVLPEAGDQFNRLKLTKSPPGRMKLATTTTETTTAVTTATEPTATEPTATKPTGPELTSNAFYPEDSIIASNFDINSELVASWGTGAIPPLSPDVGAFRFICNAGQLLYDDPIVYPGRPGASHLHQYFGNTSANAHSTYTSLRTEGQSTCNSPLNRSAYWMPAMMNGAGQVVRPDYISIYYKRWPASDRRCQPSDSQFMGTCIPLPNGLRYVFGVDMLNSGANPTGAFYFNCDGPGATPGHYKDIVTAALHCPAGTRLGAVIHAPQCWDGKNLDSADHRSHVAYAGYGWWGYLKCPATHPYVIPEFTMAAWYTVDENLDRSGTWVAGQTKTWHLSSDIMPGMAPARPGTTFHADWWGAWDNIVQAMWMDNCIDKRLSCSGGDLGNGKQLKMFSGFSWHANPRLVPVP